MRYKIQIAGISHAQSCYRLSDGNVSLYYRIGTADLWKTLETHAASGKCTMQFNE